jgi:VacB/RNase II family 3'-5' exoribonuclease
MHVRGNARQRLSEIARRAMLERGLEPEFSAAAQAEAQATRGQVDPSGALRDLRDRLWCSIDNDDSRDLDQLTVAVDGASGGRRVLVAVADVDAAVAKDSAVDAHARVNTTSVYTAAQVFPMLPERMSTDLTSLNQDADRLAIIVDVTVGADGAVAGGEVYRARVRNRAKLAYNAVAAWLDGRGPLPPAAAAVTGLDANLRAQDAIAQALKTERHRRGSLLLRTLETRAVFDGDALAGLQPDEENRARQLIEDFMIAANGVTARFLAARHVASLRRVLRTPERWDRIVALAAEHGGHLPDAPEAVALAGFLAAQRAADPERFPDLSLAVVKLLGKGEYVVNRPDQPPTGHFALAVRDYAHSTAPNRRFPDLITQRLLKSALAERAPAYGADELDGLARHCTEQEDDAAKVERQVRKSAAALLLEGRIGERFDALVTGASDKGTWVRITRPPVEGRLVRGFERLDVGDRVDVTLKSTDVERGFIDFERRSS